MERLEQLADQVQTRILEGRQARVSGSHAGNQQDKYDSFCIPVKRPFRLSANTQVGAGTQLCLGKTCAAICKGPCFAGLADKLVVQQLADKGTDAHVNCTIKIHASDAQLKKDAKKMGAFVDMLSEDMPYECALVTHFDWVAKNLFNL